MHLFWVVDKVLVSNPIIQGPPHCDPKLSLQPLSLEPHSCALACPFFPVGCCHLLHHPIIFLYALDLDEFQFGIKHQFFSRGFRVHFSNFMNCFNLYIVLLHSCLLLNDKECSESHFISLSHCGVNTLEFISLYKKIETVQISPLTWPLNVIKRGSKVWHDGTSL